MEYLTELFCRVDDFCQIFEAEQKQHLLTTGQQKRQRATGLSLSELMTLTILFHQLRFRQFKAFYLHYVQTFLRQEFPTLPSYNRCVELMPRCFAGLFAFFQTVKGACTGISFIDSTKLPVCHNRRIIRHKVFAAHAGRGKSSMGWFYGFKLHLVINHIGEPLDFRLTSGNTDDRKPVKAFCQKLVGLLAGDKGYLSAELREQVALDNVRLITPVRKKMKPLAITPFEKYVLQHRGLIETVNDELKNLCQIEHTRHRSVNNFLVNLMAGLVAYCLSQNKPKIAISSTYLAQTLAA
ncbi:MAG: IS982 family transposase [Moraxellaceae bacterium]|nr:IS982 family transposase [Moraxellaceae bacterium]